jgi:hypothetical protein
MRKAELPCPPAPTLFLHRVSQRVAIMRQQHNKQKVSKRAKVASSRRFRERRLEQLKNDIEKLKYAPQDISPRRLYELPTIFIDEGIPTAKTRQEADFLFQKYIVPLLPKGARKVGEKMQHLRQLLHAAKKAMYDNGTIANIRRRGHPNFSLIRLQIIERLIQKGLFWERRSKGGSPKMSRLVPTLKLRRYEDKDPFEFDPKMPERFVELYKRGEDKIPILFELDKLPPGHIARETHDRLALINEVNNQYKITYQVYSSIDKTFTDEWKQLRPIHYAVFTERWDWHGRIYTYKRGHQSLRKVERKTIHFSGSPSVERDYSGMHTRMLYHLHNIPYRDDPYKLWGKKTTPLQRLLAKNIVNMALNARTRRSAMSACSNAMRTRTKTGERKTGDKLLDALKLHEAFEHNKKRTGMKLPDVYDLALEVHKPIAQYFGSDAGIWLMRMDSTIALFIMSDFAEDCIPCLCCHDSFVVPEDYESKLIERMTMWYSLIFRNHLPVIK